MVMLSKLISMVYIMYRPLKIQKQPHGVQVKKDLVNSRMKSDINRLFQDQETTIQQIIPVANTCFPVLKIMELENSCPTSAAIIKENCNLRHQDPVLILHQVTLVILKVSNSKCWKHKYKIPQEVWWIELHKQHKELKEWVTV